MSQATKKLNPFEILSAKKELDYNWRVLIVEDEPAIADGIKSIISPASNVISMHRSSRQRPVTESEQADVVRAEIGKDKFEVIWAKNPTEALQYVKSSLEIGKPFAMGFFDVLLGSEIDGIELVRQIHLVDPKIYSVFVTAYHDRTVDTINQILGPSKSDRWDYMNKPFTDGSILQKARNSIAIWNLKEQKKLQDEQLAEAANLLLQGERTNTVAAVGRSVAHEFGNLLMRIVGHAEIALMKGDEANMRQALTTILKAGDTASAVLKKFKRSSNADSDSDIVSININRCLDEAIDLMAHEFKKKNIQIERIKYDLCVLKANYHSLVQVFINVFINATHALPLFGKIDVSIQNAKSNTDEAGDSWIEIRIRDYGPGIPENILPNVMAPFYTTKGHGGTGLGLGICKEIVEAEHAGEFTIANHPQKGLEVLIRLPALKDEV